MPCLNSTTYYDSRMEALMQRARVRKLAFSGGSGAHTVASPLSFIGAGAQASFPVLTQMRKPTLRKR